MDVKTTEKQTASKLDIPSSELDEKQRKAAEKAARKAEFEAKFSKEKAAKEAAKVEAANKSKAELRAERRALQDAQRAAKATPEMKKPKDNKKPIAIQPQPEAKIVTPSAKAPSQPQDEAKPKNEVCSSNKLYSHLARSCANIDEIDTTNIPPIVIQVGYRIHNKSIRGSTAKCMALLKAFQHVIRTFESSENTDLSRELQHILFDDCLGFLNRCRPLSISQDNAVKYLRSVLNRLTADMSEKEVRGRLIDAIDEFISDEILCSWKAIIGKAVEIIDDRDVLMTIGYSSLLQKILISAHRLKPTIRVVVVDTRPRFEGKQMLQELLEVGIVASYIFIDTVPYAMKQITKVIMSAESLFANGHVMAAMGSSQIALIARSADVPVIVCCETYKFSERVHTDCFVHNELGCDRDCFAAGLQNRLSGLDHDTVGDRLDVLDVVYDLTPSELISAVITEKGMLPTTSALPVLRVRETK